MCHGTSFHAGPGVRDRVCAVTRGNQGVQRKDDFGILSFLLFLLFFCSRACPELHPCCSALSRLTHAVCHPIPSRCPCRMRRVAATRICVGRFCHACRRRSRLSPATRHALDPDSRSRFWPMHDSSMCTACMTHPCVPHADWWPQPNIMPSDPRGSRCGSARPRSSRPASTAGTPATAWSSSSSAATRSVPTTPTQ